MTAAGRDLRYLQHASGQDDVRETAEAVQAHEQPGRATPPPPPAAPRRSFGARVPGRPAHARPPRPAQPDPHVNGEEPPPGPGHPAQAIPKFPAPLPGTPEYRVPDPSPVVQQLDVGPAEPYYSGGLAHGVQMPEIPHGGRPAARPEDRHAFEVSALLEHPEPLPDPDPIPVYVVERSAGNRPLAKAVFRRVPVMPGADPLVLVPRDLHRTSVRLLNEGSPGTERLVVAPANPAAGALYTYTMQSAGRLKSIGWTFTADAVAATRYQDLVISTAAGDILWQQSASGSIIAGQVSYVALGSGFGTLKQQGAGLSETGLPDLDLQPGDTITISIQNIDPGDQISAIVLSILPAAGGGVRLHSWPGDIGGVLLPAGMTSYAEIDTQDEIWAVADPAAPGTSWVSVISQYEVPGAG